MYESFAANSLRRRLSLWLCFPLLVVGLAGMARTILIVRRLESTVGQSTQNVPLQIVRGIADTTASPVITRNGHHTQGDGLLLDGIAPIAASLLLLALANVLIVSRCLRPLDRLQQLATRLDPERLEPIRFADAPLELRPVVDSIDRLMTRLSSRREADRQFTRSAAHLLRTPIAAVSVQASNLANVPPNQREERLAELQQGIQRLTSLASQLLTLANADAEVPVDRVTEVDLRRVVYEVVATLLPFAIQRDVDLGADGIDEVKVRVSEADLKVLLRNVIDNAIRYSGAGAHVDITVSRADDVAVILVIDDGPGVAGRDIDQVFERFQHGETLPVSGSGLGLPIARALAARNGGTVKLETRLPHAKGMIVRTEIPAVSDCANEPGM